MRRSRIFQICFATIGLLLASGVHVACDPGAGNALITADRFPSAYAQVLCGSLRHCCDENAVTYDDVSCTAGWKAAIEKRLSDPTLASNYDARAATDCVGQVRAAAANPCVPQAGSISDARATCMQIFVGKKATGESCTEAGECAPSDMGRVTCEPAAPVDAPDTGTGHLPLHLPGLHIGSIPLGGAPVCMVSAAPAEMDPCRITGDAGPAVSSTCAFDGKLYCDPITMTCLALPKPGGACVPGACMAGAYCVPSGPNIGTCAATLPAGSPCDDVIECDGSTVCDLAASKTCVPRKKSGESCTLDVECAVGACDGTTKKCLVNAIATSAACVGIEN